MYQTLLNCLDAPITGSGLDFIKGDLQPILAQADEALIIAPESDSLLYDLTLLIEASDCENLGSSSRAVKISSDKIETAKALGKLSPTTREIGEQGKMDFPIIAKPRSGVSGEGVFLAKEESDLLELSTDYILQEHVPGQAMSASMLIGKEINLISINTQEFSHDFNYSGATLPASTRDPEPIYKAAEKIKGLHGYVGVDFIETGEEPLIIEVNARPTTPIIAFEATYGMNISKMILDNHHDRPIAPVEMKEKVKIKKFKGTGGIFNLEGYSIQLEVV